MDDKNGNDSSDDDFRVIGDRNWSKIKAASHSVSCAGLISTFKIWLYFLSSMLTFLQEGYRNGIEEGKVKPL